MTFHVMVSAGGLLGPSASENDVDESALRDRFVEPYEQGRAIVAGGKTFPPADPPTVQIFEGPSADELKEEHGLSDPGLSHLAGRLTDVTARFISKPFGSSKQEARSSGEESTKVTNGAVFIVHGRDTDKAARVAAYVRQLVEDRHDVVVLKDAEDSGQTLIEKFESNSAAVQFAIVLATADDVGSLAESNDLKPRARQNVILELGYFWGALGRDHVAVLHEPGVELPSDLGGLLTVDPDDEQRLAKRLHHAGVQVNAQRLLD